MTISNCSCFKLEEAMDKIWFHNNILLFHPHDFSILSMLHKEENTLKSSTSSEEGIFYESLRGAMSESRKKKKIIHKMKKLERLNITENKIPEICGRHWSICELKNYEIGEFNGLNFVFGNENFGSECMEKEEQTNIEETDMKIYLRLWAQRVAFLADNECHM